MSKHCFYLFIVFYTFFIQRTHSQETYEFIGVLKLENTAETIIPYKLNFDEKEGVVKGYSITDMGGSHETKNIIEGTYNEKTKEFSFKEVEILYTKSPLSKNTFCFIHFDSKIKIVERTKNITGNFKGKFNDDSPCINGVLSVIGLEKVQSIIEKVDKKIEKKSKTTPEKPQLLSAKNMLDSLSGNKLYKNENLNLFWKSDNIKITFYDNAKKDGDKINVFHNGKLLLRNFEVSKIKDTLNVTLTENKNIFKIVAQNTGSIAPNTAQIDLVDQDRLYGLTTNLNKGEFTTLTIIKN